ncbi:class I SAM-dependent methyltransferase [Sphingomonas sp. GM_Shp_2]|uniref:class I SAM-dependent methyltransferase n=1 Tax=Sphingomonas sp. GM_Shp_2 TaxID=2937380 RepID=UPI0022698491|nr:class I SAM-dependent methyltransferase [Sphingomonas sp. GM_Shp_2]
MLDALFARLANRSPRELLRLSVKTLCHHLRAHRPAARAARRADRAFDRAWGTDTSGMVAVHDLALRAERRRSAVHYAPSTQAMLRDPVATLGIDPRDYHFIDYGAGKGRMVMLAQQLGFVHATGVELSPHLCEIARRNLATLRERSPALPPAAIFEGDACEYLPAGQRLCVYLYNPFDATVLAGVRARLDQALTAGTERIVVIYANPEQAQIFHDAPGWRAGPVLPDTACFIAGAA